MKLVTAKNYPAKDFADIDWSKGVDLNSILLPVDESLKEKLGLDYKEAHAASWALGLVAASAISSHEAILYELKDEWWENPLKKRNASEEDFKAGNKFFEEESVHSASFRKFIATAAAELNITIEEMNSFLPTYKRSSFLIWLYRLERILGGHAVWWTVAITEEESICLYRMINQKAPLIDPLYLEINRLHFLEEVRHSSYSYKMLSQEQGFATKFSYHVSRVLQTIWMISQLKRIQNVQKFEKFHPVLKEMSSVSKKIQKLSFFEKMKLIFKDVSYFTMMMSPKNHLRITRQLNKNAKLTTVKLDGVQS